MKEKAATRALDALAAERRRLPMVRIEKSYRLRARGPASLVDLFEGAANSSYHFMFAPGTAPVRGCLTFTTTSRPHPPPAARHDLRAGQRAPGRRARGVRAAEGWTVPRYSTHGSDFNHDFGSPPPTGNETFGLSVFLRDGDEVFRTYHTNGRGVDRLGST